MHTLLWFADIDTDDHEMVGKHARQLGELYQTGFPVLPGFVVTSATFQTFITANDLEHKIRALLSTLDLNRADSLMQGASLIKRLIEDAPLPQQFLDELTQFYQTLDSDLSVNAYMSTKHGFKHSERVATSEDELIEQIKTIWIEHYDAQALAKRHHHALDHITSGMEIIVQATVEAEKSGKIYTMHPDHHGKETLVIETLHPHAQDRYEITKRGLLIAHRKLHHHTKHPKLTHEELLQIAQLGRELEQHLYFPQEITWGISENIVMLLHTKPMSTTAQEQSENKVHLSIARGTSITTTIGSGAIKIINHLTGLNGLSSHHIVVVNELKPHHVKHIKHLRGIIVESGDRHSEAATLLRQHGIPAIFHVKDATKQFRDGHFITIHAGKGEIYQGGFH